MSGSLDTSIRVWDVESGQCRHTLVGHQSLTSGMELKNNTLVSGNADSTVKVWDIITGNCLQTLSGESNSTLILVKCWRELVSEALWMPFKRFMLIYFIFTQLQE